MANAKLVIGLTYLLVPVVCIPVYLAFTISETYPRQYTVSRSHSEL